MPFQYLRRVYLKDTDAAGVVYFARGLEICHEAYEESLANSKIDLQQMLVEKKVALPIVHAEINFLGPLFCGDCLTINLAADGIGNSEFSLEYQIFKEINCDRILAKAKTKHVCIDPNIRARINLPPTILNWLKINKNKDCNVL